MGVIKFSREYPAESDLLWMVVSDFSQVHKISFQVEKTQLLSDKDYGLGAERLCHRFDGRKSKERAVAWDESTMSYEIQVITGLPYDYAKLSLSVVQHPDDAEKCTVSGAFEYTVAFGPLGKLFDMLSLRNTLQDVFELYLAGVEYHLKTGENVGKDFNLQMLKDIDDEQ